MTKSIWKNDEKSAKQIIAVLKKDQRHAINFAPDNEDTLLYLYVWRMSAFIICMVTPTHSLNEMFIGFCRSCQNGLADLVENLIENGADCRPNENTKYTPLYAAIRGGHQTIVELLLKQFPESICVSTLLSRVPFRRWIQFQFLFFTGFNHGKLVATAHGLHKWPQRHIRFAARISI